MDTIEYFPIEVEQTDWQNSQELLTNIRYKVFVDEQKVPIEEEIDEDDVSAIHWLAYGSDDTPMATARLLKNGHVGRMAVLKQFREHGVGSSLMRNIIHYGIREGMNQLFLNAQIKAIPFYEGFGFIVHGETFQDAGIPHKLMKLNLHNYHDKSPEQKLPDISEDERLRTSIEGVDAFGEQAQILVQRAHREIRIFSHRLEADIYNNDELCEAIYNFATSHPLAKVKIIVKDVLHLINHPNQLHKLCSRLPSRIEIRKFFSKENCLHTEFLLVDRTGILYKQEPERFIGYVTQHSPRDAKILAEEFDELWEQGVVDPELRRLHI